jgi:branched-chain amino acid transport system permease protein
MDLDIIFSPLLMAGIFVILAISLNLINGFTGMFSLGHAAFFGVGAYTAAVYMNLFAPPLYSAAYWLHFVAGTMLAVVVSGVAGLLVGVPCLRLAGDYLAIVTLAFAEIFKILLDSFMPDVLGGPKGLRLVVDKMDAQWAFCIAIVMIIAVTVFAANLKRSAAGRAFMAIRENEIAARVMGMNVAFLKVEAFAIGAAIAGMAGALFAYSNYLIAPSNFDLMLTIMVLLMIVLGGQGSITGSIVGALILALVDPMVRYVPEFASRLTQSRAFLQVLQMLKENPELIYAFLLVLLIRLRPQGIFGMHEWGHYWGSKARN